MNPPGMLCTDLDGTLLTSDGAVSSVTVEALSSARTLGLHVIFATGRPARDVLGWAKESGMVGLIACSNGAVMQRIGSGRVLFRHAFTTGQLHRVFEHIKQSARRALMGVDTEHELLLQPGFAERVPNCWPHMEATDLSRQVTLTNRAVKILVAHPELSAPQLAQVVREDAALGIRITYSTPHFLEITPERANKGEALRWAAAYLRIPPSATAAVGDMPNDIPMLRSAGLPAAVANAHVDVQAAAQVMLPSNEDDGVAFLINSLLDKSARQ